MSSLLTTARTLEVALLADGRVACVIESYEERVHCVDREGVGVGSFGRKGEGPGEFGGASALVRGDVGTIGVVDFELSRSSVFEPSGAFVSSVSLPGVTFSPVASFDTVVTGVSRRLMMPGDDNDGPLMTQQGSCKVGPSTLRKASRSSWKASGPRRSGTTCPQASIVRRQLPLLGCHPP